MTSQKKKTVANSVSWVEFVVSLLYLEELAEVV
jgi:hypothetical protein